MNNENRLEVYRAQTINVRLLLRAKKQIIRMINQGLIKNNYSLVEIQTKLLLLTYNCWVEANFSKLIHTPHGFSLDEINQIKSIYRRSSFEDSWFKCLELGLRKVNPGKKSNYIPNISKKIKKIIEKFVIEPNSIRNRIAHGQWIIALNSENSNVNQEITANVQSIDLVIIEIWFRVQEYLFQIIESMIESPTHAFHKDLKNIFIELEDFIERSTKMNLSTKIDLLKKKYEIYEKNKIQTI